MLSIDFLTLEEVHGILFLTFFLFFHLGTSRAFSAIQRCRFVHGHVHILIPMPWEHRFSLISAFSTWGPLCVQRDSALSVYPWTCSYSNSHALGASFFMDFWLFNLGTSGAFSAIQRNRFVHGHVHILTPMPWEHYLHLIFAFSTWGPLVPSARFSAIGLSMDMFIF